MYPGGMGCLHEKSILLFHWLLLRYTIKMKNCVQIFKFESIITEKLKFCTLHHKKTAFCMGIHKLTSNFLKNPKTRVRLFCVYNKNLKENRWKKFHACSPFSVFVSVDLVKTFYQHIHKLQLSKILRSSFAFS
jgi:hypothetical protein